MSAMVFPGIRHTLNYINNTGRVRYIYGDINTELMEDNKRDSIARHAYRSCRRPLPTQSQDANCESPSEI